MSNEKILYRLEIYVPERLVLNGEKIPKAFWIDFDTQEAQEDYVKRERKACADQLKGVATAWGTDSMLKAHIELYQARKKFYESTKVTKPVEQELA